jgi:uncharacterized protein YacL
MRNPESEALRSAQIPTQNMQEARRSAPAVAPGSAAPGDAKELAVGASWATRGLLVVGSAAVCYSWQPFGLPRATAGVLGALFAALVLVTEMRLRRGVRSSVLGGAIGTVAGIFAALATSLLLARTSEGDATKSCLEFLSLFAFAYLGLMLGSSLGADFLEKRGGNVATSVLRSGGTLKLLDTSVLIDGRIADICEAHFMDGVLGIPQFILHELQMVADSSDTLKRQRGRRGLEILQRMQKLTHLEVHILDDAGIPAGGDVDDKLVELARSRGAKIVTNDFNLNKVATLQGIAVLNVNLLANAMKPAVLPGEPMRVLVVREGKEPNQGVAYLDDGTMVVVDGARKLIGKSVDVVVTSVHQTTAGKMIFGRVDERGAAPATEVKQVAAGATGPARGDVGPRGSDGPGGGRAGGTVVPERR